MARHYPIIIPPFPLDIDRDSFGNWLSGFVDGEGCFHLNIDNKGAPQGFFSISLRADDLPIIQKIQSYWQTGRIGKKDNPKSVTKYMSKPIARYIVSDTKKLINILVPHFDKYPLRAKKSRDFQIWKIGISILEKSVSRPRRYGRGRLGYLPKLTDQEKSDFFDLVKTMREVRQFDSSAIDSFVVPDRIKNYHKKTESNNQLDLFGGLNDSD